MKTITKDFYLSEEMLVEILIQHGMPTDAETITKFEQTLASLIKFPFDSAIALMGQGIVLNITEE